MKIILNEDKKIVKEITDKLKETKGYCPCSLLKNEDTKCRCKAFREQTEEGYCHCSLFKKIKDKDES